MLRERPDELEAACALTPHARAEFDAADLDEDGVATSSGPGVSGSASIRATRRTPASAPAGASPARAGSPSPSLAVRLGRFRTVAERLAQVSIEHCDAADLVTRLATEETVVYLDPPYLPSTRVGRGRSQRGDYRHEMDEADHRRLAVALARTPATVLISGYPSAAPCTTSCTPGGGPMRSPPKPIWPVPAVRAAPAGPNACGPTGPSDRTVSSTSSCGLRSEFGQGGRRASIGLRRGSARPAEMGTPTEGRAGAYPGRKPTRITAGDPRREGKLYPPRTLVTGRRDPLGR